MLGGGGCIAVVCDGMGAISALAIAVAVVALEIAVVVGGGATVVVVVVGGGTSVVVGSALVVFWSRRLLLDVG